MPYIQRIDYDFEALALAARAPGRYPFLLESLGSAQARYDILFAFPQAPLITGEGFLERLDAAWQSQTRPAPDEVDLPFAGGWFVFLGYELAAEIEPVLRLPRPRSGLPIAFACRIPAALIRDHHDRQAWLVAEQNDHAGQILDDLQALGRPSDSAPQSAMYAHLKEDPADDFLRGAERILRYIRDGDVFQVNLSRAWRGQLAEGVEAVDLYRRLRHSNPGPFSGLCRLGEHAILSSSPERLVRVAGGQIETRPIAGTYPRGHDAEEDAALARALRAHPKEQAEHVMLLDLLRNDLGRIARTGSVRVDELMSLESYAHVHHLVSNVRGDLPPEVTPGQVIRAIFPGGTITGCPKVRCMEIIAELERAPREAYTGAMGYLGLDGRLDLNILIRTIQTQGRSFTFRTGAGIVADSQPLRELAETRAKARGLLAALG
jgi:anthranilate synthase component 1